MSELENISVPFPVRRTHLFQFEWRRKRASKWEAKVLMGFYPPNRMRFNVVKQDRSERCDRAYRTWKNGAVKMVQEDKG
jgi:hypothetical protein